MLSKHFHDKKKRKGKYKAVEELIFTLDEKFKLHHIETILSLQYSKLKRKGQASTQK